MVAIIKHLFQTHSPGGVTLTTAERLTELTS